MRTLLVLGLFVLACGCEGAPPSQDALVDADASETQVSDREDVLNAPPVDAGMDAMVSRDVPGDG